MTPHCRHGGLARLVLYTAVALSHGVATGQGDVGQLPLAYVGAAAAHPWTGSLRAIGWTPVAVGQTPAPVSSLWEAGTLLDRREPDFRLLYTSLAAGDGQPERLVTLQWASLDAATRARLDAHPKDGVEDGLGRQRLSWLRGHLTIDGMRERDTRLGSPRGTKELVVGPPAWQPGKPGHAAFRERYARRPHMVWIGTNDGLLHGFEATSGTERAAYLPRGALAAAAALTDPSGRLPAAPCRRPEAVDAQLGADWHTLLLCGLPARTGTEDIPGIFVLDITEPDSPTPLRLVWETVASDTLPLSARGAVRAAALEDGGRLRWYAVTTLAPAGTSKEGGFSPSGLALLPLDKPPHAPWLGAYRIVTQRLPATGCDGTPATGALLAVSVLSDMFGKALAAYAADDAGQLWRFALAESPTQPDPSPARCLHKLPHPQTPSADPDTVLAPVISGTADAPLIVHGLGSDIAALTDGPARGGTPARITAQVSADGVILRADTAAGGQAAAGWRLTLPHPDEQVESITSAAPGYLSIITRDTDGRQRGYLVHAASGESLGRAQPGAPLTLFTTGQTTNADKASAIVPTIAALGTEPPGAGQTSRDAQVATLWSVNTRSATPLATTVSSRRTGRLRWRELATPLIQDWP